MPSVYRYRSSQEHGRQVKHTRLENETEFEIKYTVGLQLGKGSFGTVLETTRTADSRKWAVKIINKEKAGSAAVKLLEREVSIMKKVDHPHIIHLEEVFETANKMFLVMELCMLGELEVQLNQKGYFSQEEGLSIFQQLADAVSYIHQNDIIHRDLKLDNILLAEPEDDSPYNIKLTDFGLSYTRGGSGSDYMINQVVGTPIYMGIHEADHWKQRLHLKCVKKILSGDAPFMANSEEELFDLIKKGNVKFPPAKWKDVSQSAKQLIECMLKVDPAHRLTSKEILQHPWLRGELNGAVTTNVLEMMKQYSLEQKQLAEKEKRGKLDSVSDASVSSRESEMDLLNEQGSSSAAESDVKESSSSRSIASPKEVTKDNVNNNSKDAPKTSKKAAAKTQSLPSYMQPTKSSRAPKNPNTKSSRKKVDPNS